MSAIRTDQAFRGCRELSSSLQRVWDWSTWNGQRPFTSVRSKLANMTTCLAEGRRILAENWYFYFEHIFATCIYLQMPHACSRYVKQYFPLAEPYMVRELERDEVDAFIVGKQIDKVRASLPAALSDHHSKDVKYPVFGRVTSTLYCNL